MKRLFTYIFAVALLAAGCEQNCEVDNIPDFELSHSEFEVSCDGEALSVKVTSKLNWTAAADTGWITLRAADIESVEGRKADSGFSTSVEKPFNRDIVGGLVDIEINIAANKYSEDRTGRIVFTTSDKRTLSISIAQKGAPYNIDMDDMEGDDDFDSTTKTLRFAAAGGQKSLGFTISGGWTAKAAEGQNWCSVTPASGQAGKQTITISAEAAESTEERTTTVTLACGTANITITIVQDGDDGETDDMGLMFPDPIFRAYVLNNFDTNKDGKISTEEAKRGRVVDVRNLNIASLEGIQYFTNLVLLYCDKNKLTTLDVSECPALESLDCANNQLTTLNVSGCTQLKKLYCTNNQLTTLDVSSYTQLAELKCDNNQLTTLNVSGCTQLTRLLCESNQLTTLDVSGCTQLTEFRCKENRLTTLDVSGCTQLSFLSCTNNQLTTLDVSGYTQVESLYCYNNKLTTLDVSECPALEVLHCYNNQLTTLKVSGCTNLYWLECYRNRLTTLEVSECAALEKFVCYSNQLTSLDVSKNTELYRLECNDNQLTSLDVSGCINLNIIYWFGNPFEYINLGDANPTEYYYSSSWYKSYPVLGDIASTSSTRLKVISSKITWLSVSNHNLQSLDVSECPVLEVLYCENNKLTTLDVSECPALEYLSCENNQLTSLDVSKTNLGNSTWPNPLDCAPMETLRTLILKKGWDINGITTNPSTLNIPSQTEIIFVD